VIVASSAALIAVSSFFQIMLSVLLVVLVLMHSGRDGGLGGLGFTPTSQGGTHIVERNLTRITIAVAILWFANTVLLFRLFS
jgi:preprotein translocase subunit SecG